MPKRYDHNLGHFQFGVGDIGKLQTLTCINVVAGDSISIDLEGVWRLAALRRNLVVDCRIDLFCFYVPHRHVYGDDWVDFIKLGSKEAITFAGVGPIAQRTSYLGSEIVAADTIPLWRTAAYNRIWNRYFRSPTDTNERADTYVSTSNLEAISGFRCGHLPTPWSTGVIAGVPSTDRDVSTVGDTFDIVDLNRIKKVYQTEVDREYFGQRYNDLLNTTFGSTVNIDADERPELCAHTKWWLSGYDIDGTGDASLGTYSGKSAGVGRINMKRKYFAEHGSLWVMALARFPTIHTNERPFLHTVVNPTYLQISGDPDLVGAEPPEDIVANEYFYSSSASVLGVGPYGQHYRYHPSIVHRLYEALDGYTFLDQQIDTIDEAHYVSDTEYDEVFQSLALRHWQSQLRIDVQAMRVVPPARRSLYAGVG